MATIGVIGSGHIGEAVAKLLIDAGNTVIMSNHHGSESLKGLINALGPKAKAGTPAEAGQQDIVILAVLRPGVADAWQKHQIGLVRSSSMPQMNYQIPALIPHIPVANWLHI
ncbi:NAD(P)-binding domain-containing protein [Secundilactobacillus collinoides]|uniref:NAD(P)-binding domain-containing protein n=1 Tax=Secundilactobacillus collinoides TaxID=33960 RepID=UPI000AC35BD6|nr:NAD(P)-binding domain-containing protein [Secundilactobacillus collinoides]